MCNRLLYALSVGMAVAIGTAASAQNPPRQENPAQGNAAPAAAESGSVDAERSNIEAVTGLVAALFNAGQAEPLAGLFLPEGELVDDEGNSHRGREPIQELLSEYFAKYPGARLSAQTDSLRIVGPLAIEEGRRVITTQDSGTAELHHLTIWARTDQGWKIASMRERPADSAPSPREQLQPMAWLVGKWVNEGADAVVTISYRWSDDGNFLLGDYLVTTGGEVTMKSEQRIGWDPLAGKVRSWMFDSDGGFSDGDWTQIDDAWVIKSSAVLPDGTTGSATLTFTPIDESRYSIKGTDRILGSMRDDDFDVTVTRKAPLPAAE
jgi:uncharacterized protein (TIGR02246 family)